jgi:hypothetical protein
VSNERCKHISSGELEGLEKVTVWPILRHLFSFRMEGVRKITNILMNVIRIE